MKLTGVDICDDQSIVFNGYDSSSFLDTKKFVAGSLGQNGGEQWISNFPEFGKVLTGKCMCGGDFQFYSVATVSDENGAHDILVNSINYQNGQVVWAKYLEQTDAFGYGITQKNNGIIYFVGTIGGIGFNSYSASINSYGGDGSYVGPENTAILGGFGTDELFDVQFTNDGGLVAVGQTNSFGNGYQAHLCKLDSLGNRDETNIDFLDLATSVNSKITENEIKIFPNPAQNYIQVDNKQSINYTFNVFGTDGRQFLSGNIKDHQLSGIDISGLPAGLFILKLYERGTLKSISRFVKLP